MASTETASSALEVEATPVSSEPQRAEVTPILGKPQWAQTRVLVENATADVSESESAVIVSGPRPSVETFLERVGVEVTAVLQVFPPPPDTTEIRKRFNNLAKRWLKESENISSITQMAMLPAYQEIIGLGPVAVPLILERLRQEPGQWFWALRAITRENPVSAKHAGRVQDMANDWIRWARKKRILV